MKLISKIILMTSASAIFVSCATSSLTLSKSDLVPFDNFQKTTKVNAKTKLISLNSITDNRDQNYAIGTAYTGISYDKTRVSLSEPLEVYLNDYVKREFASRNLVISKEGTAQLTIVVNELWVKELIEKFKPERAVCKANFTFYMQSPNAKWEGNIWTEITSPGDMGDGTEKIAPTLASCLNTIMEKLVREPKFLKFISK